MAVEQMEEQEHSLGIAFLDVGQGDATLIDFSTGEQMLIDCAVDARVLEALGRHMSFFDRSIDYLVITHPDLDHYGGCVDVMRRFKIGTIVYTGAEKENSFFRSFMQEIERQIEGGVEYIVLDRQVKWYLGDTLVYFLYPDRSIVGDSKEANNGSIIMKISYGEQDILLTGDAEQEREEYLIHRYGSLLDVEVLKGGHHGSNTSSILELVSSTSPDMVIFSAGKENRFGHPSPRVAKRFERSGSQIYRTDQDGDVVLRVSKEGIYVH